MFYVYILYSRETDRFYIGQSIDPLTRLKERLEEIHNDSYTRKASDWELYFTLPCATRRQALKIEQHLKKMRSRKYLKNIREYPEISAGLIKKYT
jgi:putative endonuclease